MNKSDLRTGMIVEDRSGKRKIVALNTGNFLAKDALIYTDGSQYGDLYMYNDDLTAKNKSHDIMKVYKNSSLVRLLNPQESNLELIWQREEETETQKQIKELEKKIAEAQQEVDKLKKMV